MRVAVGSDHAGVPLIGAAIDELRSLGHEVVDLGTHDASQPDDYPDYAVLVAEKVLNGECERGVLICGSGVGASVAANKIPGIRAGLCHDSVLGPPGGRARSHERARSWGQGDWRRTSARIDTPLRQREIQPGGTPPAGLAKVAAIEKRCAVQPASSPSPPQRQRDVGREGAALIPCPKR